MRRSEWIAFAYFIYVAAVCWWRPLPRRRRVRIALASIVMCLAIGGIARPSAGALRDWAPGVYILAGYYISGWLFVAPSPRVEAWLIGWDRRLLGDPATRFARWPGWGLAYLDTVYIFCFLLLPAGVAVLLLAGRADRVDWYWTLVSVCELGSFAPLAFVQSRPPWAVERATARQDAPMRRAAARFVREATIGVNTFPSGHTAGSLAVACAMIDTLPGPSLVFLFLAASVAVACIVGRYHYVVDVAAGAALAGGVTVLSLLLIHG